MHVLPLFPQSGFDQSVTTPVLIGVLVSWFFTETFGWVFAGLVVPGYLAAVFLLDPPGGAIDVAEAIVTYGVARVLGEHLSRTGITSRVFGRERFFLVVLVSILVRLGVEGLLLPRLAPHASWAFSIGLVVVPLAANACWKTGLFRGIVQNGVPTLAVYLLLRYVLVPYTNLSLEGFELATENVAASFLASPKAYILLVSGAVLAAAANVRYGWDFNGILVPALMGLVVIEPVKFAATLVEALVLVFVVAFIVRITPLKRANIEGPRRTVLFFTVDYALRFAFAVFVGKQLAGGDIVELMGFGYLLPTLLAVKIAQKQSVALVLLPAAQVAGAAFVVGTTAGFIANAVDPARRPRAPEVTRAMPKPPSSPMGATLWAGALALDGAPEPDRSLSAADFAGIVEDAASGGTGDPRRFGLEAQKIDDGVVVVRERFETPPERRGLPVVLARAKSTGERVVMLVPAPLDDPEAVAFAGRALDHGDADVVVLAEIDELGPTLVETQAHAVARAIAKTNAVVVVRAGPLTLRAPAGFADKPRARSLVVHLGARLDTAPAAEDVEVTAPRDALLLAAAMPDGPSPLPAAKVMPGSLIARGPQDPAALTPSQIAIALDAVVGKPDAMEFEDLLVLRRLVLSTILAPEPRPASLPTARVAAEALGFRLVGPLPLPDGAPGFALLPWKPRPLAVVVRASGVRASVVEAPEADSPHVRDVALRLGVALKSDAVILGLRESHAMHGDASRVAHAAATIGGGRAPAVLLVRQTPQIAGAPRGAHLGAWGSDNGLLAKTEAALSALAIPTDTQGVDLSAREIAARAFLGPSPLVVVSADAHTWRAASLDGARAAARAYDGSELPLVDGEPGVVAAELAKNIASNAQIAPDPGPIVRRAAIEHSVVARRALGRIVDGARGKAALSRSKAGEFLVVAARTAAGITLVAAPTDVGLAATPQVIEPDAKPVRMTTADACVPVLANGGACEVGR